MAQQKRIQLVSVRIRVRSLASLSGSGICRCHELWCRLQKQLRSFVAVAVTVSCSPDSTPSLGTSICYRSSPKKKKEKKKIDMTILCSCFQTTGSLLPAKPSSNPLAPQRPTLTFGFTLPSRALGHHPWSRHTLLSCHSEYPPILQRGSAASRLQIIMCDILAA